MMCGNPDCGDVGVNHHHIQIGSGQRQEVHGGPINECGVTECQNHVRNVMAHEETAHFPTDEEVDEKLNAVQKDLAAEAAEIAEWWVNTATTDALRTVPKAVEYGAVDFDSMGLAMVALVKDKFNGADDAELMRVGREMAAMFYLNGKIGRALGAFQQGMRPSDDTIFDICVYAMMWRRIREKGHWISG